MILESVLFLPKLGITLILLFLSPPYLICQHILLALSSEKIQNLTHFSPPSPQFGLLQFLIEMPLSILSPFTVLQRAFRVTLLKCNITLISRLRVKAKVQWLQGHPFGPYDLPNLLSYHAHSTPGLFILLQCDVGDCIFQRWSQQYCLSWLNLCMNLARVQYRYLVKRRSRCCCEHIFTWD